VAYAGELSLLVELLFGVPMGGATSECGGTRTMSPTFATSGVQGSTGGGGGPMKMVFASTADSLYSVLYK